MKNIIITSILLIFCLSLNWSAQTKLKIESLELFTNADKEKIIKVASGVETIINSEEFKNEVLNFEYNGKKEFVDNDRKSNLEIYSIIMAGKETFSQDKDFSWNLSYKLGKLGKNVIAQTSSSIKTVTINSLKFPSMLESSLAGTVCHEEMHKLGFGHAFRNNSSRPYSVPYGVGSICTRLYRKQIFDDSKFAPVSYCGLWCKIKRLF